MVTLHEPDFPSLKVTVLQTADGGNTHILLAGVPGIEPRAVESKSTVLPLHHTPTITYYSTLLIGIHHHLSVRQCAIIWYTVRESNPSLRLERAPS